MTTEEIKKPFLSVTEIQKRIPHRFPFLLIDKVDSFEHGPDEDKLVGRKIVCTKNITINEPYFQGHFPDNPVMPGVLQVESMAQAGAIACVPGSDDKMEVLIAKISDAKFRRPVVPGDCLKVYAEILSEKRGLLSVRCEMRCEGELVSEVSVLAKIFLK